MQVRRLSVKNLVVGGIYLAYSSKSKKLSSPVGTLVEVVEVSGASVKLNVLGKTEAEHAAIRNLDSRQDAWIYDPSGVEIEMQLCPDFDKGQWPRWTPRLEASEWATKKFLLDISKIYKVEREGEGQGVSLIRMEETDINPKTERPYVTNFPLNWLQPVNPPEWRIPRAERMGLGAVELPLPPKPVKPEHEEALKNLMPFLEKMVSSHEKENTSFIKVGADFKESEEHFNQVCHRNIQTNAAFVPDYICTLGLNTTTKGGWCKGRPNDEALVLWITYLTCYSPYADVFITKDPQFIIKYGYVIDTNFPNRLVAGACYATRQAWETPWRADAFAELYKSNIPLDAAFVFASQCSLFKGGKIKFSMGSSGHNHFQNAQASDKCIINFITHKPERAGTSYRKSVNASGGAGGVDGMWSKHYGSPSEIYKKLADIKNPKAPPHDNALQVDVALEIAADLIDDWMGKHGLA